MLAHMDRIFRQQNIRKLEIKQNRTHEKKIGRGKYNYSYIQKLTEEDEPPKEERNLSKQTVRGD